MDRGAVTLRSGEKPATLGGAAGSDSRKVVARLPHGAVWIAGSRGGGNAEIAGVAQMGVAQMIRTGWAKRRIVLEF
jgi:hypothetical protein